MPERVLILSQEVSSLAQRKLEDIRQVTRVTKILALNAAIEAARAGEAGAGFRIVSNEVKGISDKIESLAAEMRTELDAKTNELATVGRGLVANIRGSRLADLALNMIDIIDRNLYERSCDVRWWATDSAVVDCVAGDEASRRYASSRLGVILDSYTVYLDLWIADASGKVIANGRPERYPNVVGEDVSREEWFRPAMATRDGSEFVACNVAHAKVLDGVPVATYATAIRQGGKVNGTPLGVLGIFFDWASQAAAVVNGVRLEEKEKARTKCMILDNAGRVIACNHPEFLYQTLRISTEGKRMGTYSQADGTLVGFALTPGYETYKGLGWYGVLTQAAG